MDKKPQHIALFCDEAGKNTDRYLTVGGLVVTARGAPIIRKEFTEICSRLQIASEVKWNRTKKGNYEKFREIVNLFFRLLSEGKMNFHCLIVDFARFDHNLRDDGGESQSLKRMYYQLILHRLCKRYGKDSLLYAFPDKAKELRGLDDLKRGLNSDSKLKFRHSGNQLRAIEFRDSMKEPLLQLNDIILGAICYQKNRRNEEAGMGQFKSNLAGYVLGRTGLTDYDSDTPRAKTDLSIWNFNSQYLRGGR